MVCTYTVSNCTTLACSNAQIERKVSCVFNLIHIFFFFEVSYVLYKSPNLALHCATYCYSVTPPSYLQHCTEYLLRHTSRRHIHHLTRQLFCKFYKRSAPFKSWFTDSIYMGTRMCLCVFTLSTPCSVKHG
jgi:hypothetical protein